MIRRDIVVLPDKAVQHVLEIRDPIEKLRRCQPIAFQQQFRLSDAHSDLISAPISKLIHTISYFSIKTMCWQLPTVAAKREGNGPLHLGIGVC